ncbi:DUF3768 domain-containing protein [Brevundimonas sp.]|uniref:DUF3768 domain-containing protein n=1 Tax=Brevundimonas sp. TaxID=1871086 RepID=UPI00289971E5|nr:DUF3768 domain-containing protein [Brevundimonas sp.]
MTAERRARICALNDQLRTQHVGGRILISQGIVAEGPAFILAALGAVKHFNKFNELNDPYGEHDFGVVHIEQDKVFWKIDYYDQSLTAAADPASETDCVRVLTLMLPEEY